MTLEFLLVPPIAFVFYVGLVAILSLSGRVLAAPGQESTMKATTYAGGESSPTRPAAPGYRPFFVIALFFAILHLGILILGSGTVTPVMVIYLVGLLLALLALILG